MRILIVGHFKYEMHYGILQKLQHALIRLGHCVYHFDDRNVARASNRFNSSKLGKKALNKAFIQACQQFEPEFILLGHCELITNDTLEAVRKLLPPIRIAYRNVDGLAEPHKVAVIQNRTTAVDHIFITTAGDDLKQFSGNRAKISYMPNPVCSAIDAGRSFEHDDQPYEAFYAIGGVYKNDPRPDFVARVKQHCPNLNLRLHGFEPGTNLFGNAYLSALQQAKMGLSYSRQNDVYLYSSDRMTQYLGNGLLTFVDRATGFTEIFTEDEVAFYSDEAELFEKLNYFQKNDRQRQKIAENGWQAAHTKFSADLIAQYILDHSFQQPLSKSYNWPTDIYK